MQARVIAQQRNLTYRVEVWLTPLAPKGGREIENECKEGIRGVCHKKIF